MILALYLPCQSSNQSNAGVIMTWLIFFLQVHRKFDSKMGNRKNSSRNFKAACSQACKQSVREIRKQNRSSGQSSMLTSPETNPPENPFTFHHSVSAASTASMTSHSGAKPLPTHPHHTRNRKTKKRHKDRSYDRDLKLLGAGTIVSSIDWLISLCGLEFQCKVQRPVDWLTD